MGNLYDTIISLCESRGIKGAKLCNDTGISKGLLTDLKMGRRTGVSAVTAQKIAAYFDVSVGYLLGEEAKENSPDEYVLTEGEKDLIQLFRMIPVDQQPVVLAMIKAALVRK